MKIFKILILFSLSNLIFGQEKIDSIVPVKISYLDSIKKTFVHDETAACVDASLINELTNKELFNDLIKDIENFDFSQEVEFELSTDLLKERLKTLDDKTDFDISYNPGLENVIKHYLKNRKKSIERLMGLSEYYFPLYESTLAKHNVPLEIKYLSIVESALNPKAVSRVGATGLWQFMYYTGKEYGLEIDTYIDERSDPIKSSEAACEYMKKMYKVFGDWDLCLASYNAGPGNVSKAIRRSGGKQNYWNIRPFLPKETQGYVPAFLATMYMFEFHKEHGLKPQKPVANLFATDTIMIKNKITFKQISDLLEISEEHIRFFNPIYKRDVIPFIKGKPLFLRLPVDKIAVFTSNEDKIYAYANYDFNKKEKYNYKEKEVVTASNNSNETIFKTIEKVKYHKIKKGETLSEIASKYDVTLSEIKKWNGLRKNTAQRGVNLKIISEEKIAIQPKTTKDTVISVTETSTNSIIETKNETIIAKKTTEAPLQSLTEKVNNNDKLETKSTVSNNVKPKNEDKTIHTVKKGEGLITIARQYNTTEDLIKNHNKINKKGIYVGQKLVIFNSKSIEVKTDKEFDNSDYHIVKENETLYSISKIYDLSINALKKLNNFDKDNLDEGEKLIVRKINNSDKKETVIKETVIKETVIKETKKKKPETYKVKSGDTLSKIAKKYENVTVKDIENLNKIKGRDIRPGMILKIKA
jgi:membrane-bound lytic murein transglycosylase D